MAKKKPEDTEVDGDQQTGDSDSDIQIAEDTPAGVTRVPTVLLVHPKHGDEIRVNESDVELYRQKHGYEVK